MRKIGKAAYLLHEFCYKQGLIVVCEEFMNLKCALILSFGLHSLPSFAQDVVPQTFAIKNIQTNGDACPQGTTLVNISEDRQAFTLVFSQFVVQKGPGAEPGDKRKFCRAVFDTEQDPNWEFAIVGINTRGFVSLDDKVVGTQEIQFGPRGRDFTVQKQFFGPTSEDYVNSDVVALPNAKWSGCRSKAGEKLKDFVIRATADLRGGGRNAAGLMTVDTIDGGLVQDYELVWRQCGDKRAKFLASCQVQGLEGRSIAVKGMGRSEALARAKAEEHLTQRCARVKGQFGACDISVAQCSVSPF